MSATRLSKLWATCVDRLKDRSNSRSFWEALEATQAVTVENGILVVGLPVEEYHRASHILQTATMHLITTVVGEVFQEPLQVRLIEGVTPEDWAAHQENQARAQAMRAAASLPRPNNAPADATVESWEGLYDQIARLYAGFPHRSLPQGKARFANEALYLLADTMEWLYPDPADDVAERGLGRVLDRISINCDIPAATLGFELERLRAWRKTDVKKA